MEMNVSRPLRPLLRQSLAVRIGGTLAAIAVATVVIYPLRTAMPVVSTGVVYLVAVLVVSTTWGIAFGLAASVLSAAAFNFFHLPETGGFTLDDPKNWVTLGVFLASSVIASGAAELARRREELHLRAVEAEALRRSDLAKTAILRAVSHDLRSPLTVITAAAQALNSPSLSPDERRQFVAAVADRSSEMSELIDKLLELSRLESGAAQPRADWCSIDELLRTAADRVALAPDSVSIDVEGDLPLIRADAAQLDRAFVNLIENAKHHALGKPVQVRAERSKGGIKIMVRDSGPGLAETDLDRVFEPFYRADSAMHRGSGLGLAIARGFVEANGGLIHAEKVDQGASFVVELPAVGVEDAE